MSKPDCSAGSVRSTDPRPSPVQIADTTFMFSGCRTAASMTAVVWILAGSYASSVCLFHVVVAFRDRTTGRRVRFTSIDPQGKP